MTDNECRRLVSASVACATRRVNLPGAARGKCRSATLTCCFWISTSLSFADNPLGFVGYDSVCIIHPMTSAELIRELKSAGWMLDRVHGSHHIFVHPIRSGIVVVPHPKKDLGKGLVKAIRKQGGLE